MVLVSCQLSSSCTIQDAAQRSFQLSFLRSWVQETAVRSLQLSFLPLLGSWDSFQELTVELLVSPGFRRQLSGAYSWASCLSWIPEKAFRSFHLSFLPFMGSGDSLYMSFLALLGSEDSFSWQWLPSPFWNLIICSVIIQCHQGQLLQFSNEKTKDRLQSYTYNVLHLGLACLPPSFNSENTLWCCFMPRILYSILNCTKVL